jgi:hypothetical protein
VNVSEGQLADALDGFYSNVSVSGAVVQGQIVEPDKMARALFAALSRIAALSEPEGVPDTEPDAAPFNGDHELTLLAMVIEAFDEMGEFAVARCMSYLSDRYPPE